MSIQEVNQILGNCSEFYMQQIQRLLHLGIDVHDRTVSHLAYRTATLAEYLEIRQQLEHFCSANVKNIWGGRPISKLLLHTPLPLAPDNAYAHVLTGQQDQNKSDPDGNSYSFRFYHTIEQSH